jgi:hypothetical protein
VNAAKQKESNIQCIHIYLVLSGLFTDTVNYQQYIATMLGAWSIGGMILTGEN